MRYTLLAGLWVASVVFDATNFLNWQSKDLEPEDRESVFNSERNHDHWRKVPIMAAIYQRCSPDVSRILGKTSLELAHAYLAPI
jgi:hypothetical protein